MSEITYDIGEMLDGLGLTTAAIRWNQILNNPELGNFTAQQLFREVLTPQYIEFKNNQYETNLKFSRLIDKSARIENLKTELISTVQNILKQFECVEAGKLEPEWRKSE